MRPTIGSGRAAVLVLAAATACAPPAAPPGARPSIVLISIDTLRSDRLPAYGYGAGSTPAIDRLARDGILFERAYSPAPLTLPAHASLFTGLLPPEHGVRDNLGYRLDGARHPTLAAALRAAGYRTGGAVSAFVLRGETALGEGFDLWQDEVTAGAGSLLGEAQRSGTASLAAALEWLDDLGPKPEPFFLFLHLYEPHAPYTPPAALAASLADPYDGEVAVADQVVGELLAVLERKGLYEGSAMVLLGDHGEGLGDHGEAEHGILLHREALQVPLILKLPGGERGGSRDALPRTLIDVAPTVLSLARLPERPELAGRSLLAPVDPERPLYAETYHPYLRYGWSALLSVIAGPWHLIEGPAPELYDVVADAGERHPLGARHPEVRERLLRALRAVDRAPEPPFAESEAVRDRLAALGYLDFGRRSSGPRPDPKSRLAALERLRRAVEDLRAARLQAAERALEALTREDPESLEAWQFLGEVYREQRRWPEAYQALGTAFSLGNGAPLLAPSLAQAAYQLGRPDEAVELLGIAVAGSPQDLALRFRYVELLLGLGRADQAAAAAAETVGVVGEVPDALFQLGLARLAAGDAGGAENALRRALGVAPDHAAALYQLGLLRAAHGDIAEARRLLEEVLRVAPDDDNARRALAELESGAS